MSEDVKELLAVAEKQLWACERAGKLPEINVPVWRAMFKAARERIQQLEDELLRGRAA